MTTPYRRATQHVKEVFDTHATRANLYNVIDRDAFMTLLTNGCVRDQSTGETYIDAGDLEAGTEFLSKEFEHFCDIRRSKNGLAYLDYGLMANLATIEPYQIVVTNNTSKPWIVNDDPYSTVPSHRYGQLCTRFVVHQSLVTSNGDRTYMIYFNRTTRFNSETHITFIFATSSILAVLPRHPRSISEVMKKQGSMTTITINEVLCSIPESSEPLAASSTSESSEQCAASSTPEGSEQCAASSTSESSEQCAAPSTPKSSEQPATVDGESQLPSTGFNIAAVGIGFGGSDSLLLQTSLDCVMSVLSWLPARTIRVNSMKTLAHLTFGNTEELRRATVDHVDVVDHFNGVNDDEDEDDDDGI
jgi:hypothetical protein